MTIVEFLDFLKARLDEDEAVARAARPSEHLRTRDNGALAVVEDNGYSTCSITSGRVLRQVATNRAIVVEHTCDCPDPDCRECGACSGAHHDDPTAAPCDTLRHLAAVYSDHPDYPEQHRP